MRTVAAAPIALSNGHAKGYGATTPAELVEALGIAEGSLYNAFERKCAHARARPGRGRSVTSFDER